MTAQNNTNLDVNWKIVDASGKPTRYFEELWFNMVSTMGGENDNLISDLQAGQKIAAFSSIISKLEKDIQDLNAAQKGRIDLTNIQQGIDELRAQIQNRIDLSGINKRLDDLEATN
jgi:hypothetical protein